MRAAFITLGCKVNQYETQIVQQQFEADGFTVVEPSETADVYIINSCTVTATGDKKTRQLLRRFKKQNPAACTVLTGCFPQAYPALAAAFDGADVVTGAYRRDHVLEAVKRFLKTGERVVDIVPHQKNAPFEPMCAERFLERTRAFIKIQDGCDRYCSYCIIPTARGPIRSKKLEDLRTELIGLAQKGYREAVLVGINLSLYGKEYGLRLVDAVECACAVDGIERVRLGSLEPELIADEDLERMSKQPKFCPQFHLSLQSGCTDTLKRMNRHYTADEYAALVDKIRAHFQNPTITTDIMVGFPSEDEREFSESCAFVERVRLFKAHVFAYSRRPNTRADRMEYQVSRTDKEDRSRRLIRVCNAVRKAELEKQVGQVVNVLFETTEPNGEFGYSENYTPVFVKSDRALHGEILTVRLVQATDDACIGELI